MTFFRLLAGAALIGSAAIAAAPALAQSAAFPTKTIKIIVPYPAGGATDVAARLLAPRLQEELKQTVVIENKPGASGNLGMVTLLQSPADGHTLAMSLTGMLSINPTTYSKAGFTAADFVPVARVSLAPLVLVVPVDSPYKTARDLVAAGKAAGKNGLPYGSAGAGGLSHLASELLNSHADGNYSHIPYKGGSPLVQALMANEVRWGLLGTADARNFLQGGKLRALGQLRSERSDLWPDLPTLTEQGLKGGVDFDVWFGLVAPAKTPPAVVALLNQKIAQIVAEPEFRKRLNELGGVAPATGNTPEAFGAVIQRELAVLPKAATDLGLRMD
ncbi:Bug family tripartite tricarboxylate transporter substrate binding protein [Piscinibacter sakaiensis]|uniref:Bug family tripartite tricarboxylate transporter substrate binding protein n=1 Tax=Piscinibacter sakaiensis TaxID=1547922 RepID=UPI003AAA4308